MYSQCSSQCFPDCHNSFNLFLSLSLSIIIILLDFAITMKNYYDDYKELVYAHIFIRTLLICIINNEPKTKKTIDVTGTCTEI